MIPHAGSQLWADVRWRHGWRIQSHWVLPVCRLLDPSSQSKAQGTFDACEHALDALAPTGSGPDHLVVILHGLGRTRHSMRQVDRALGSVGLTTARLDYPSTRGTIERHASQVEDVLTNTEAPARVSFVTHSLGGLIVRELLSRNGSWRSRVDRVVMFAPPNHGAAFSKTVDTAGLRAIMGPSFRQLANGVANTLPIPDVPTAIVAGEIGKTGTDGLVTVAETRLEGMVQHLVVPTLHTFVMNHPDAIRCAVEFLRSPQGT